MDRPVEIEIEKWSERIVEVLVDREVEKLVAAPAQIVEVEKIVYVTDPKMEQTIQELKHSAIQQEIDHKKQVDQLNEDLDKGNESLECLQNQQKIDRKRKRRLMNRIHQEAIWKRHSSMHLKVAYAVGVVLMLLGYFSH